MIELDIDHVDIDHEKGNFHYDVEYKHDAGRGLTEKTIDYIAVSYTHLRAHET